MADLKHRKHLFFDLDDTLWDFEKNSRRALEELFVEFDLQDKLKADFTDFHEAYKKITRDLWNAYHKKEIDKSFFRGNRFAMAFREFKYYDTGESLQMNEHYMRRSPEGKYLKEGCLDILKYLREKYSLHIITNGFKEVQHIKIKGSGIGQFFTNVVISEEHGFTKPDEKIFRLAESLAGASQNDCVMIGDNFDCDVKGALNAGWETVYFSEKEHGYLGHSINSLVELKVLF